MTNFKKSQINSYPGNKEESRRPDSQKCKQTYLNSSCIRVQRLKSQKVQGVSTYRTDIFKVQQKLKKSIFWSKVD